MTYSISPGLLDLFPGLDELLVRVRSVACSLDRDIRVSDLRVEARKHRGEAVYQGWAHPRASSVIGGRTVRHRDGLVRLAIGSGCEDEDIIRVFAHELRHIGQFHRGRRHYGQLSLAMCEVASEQDAEDFEDRVLERLA